MLYGFFYFLSICPTGQAGQRHDSLVGLVGLVGQAAPMPDSLVGQAAGCYFYFFAQVKNLRGPGHQGPDRVGPGSNPSRVRGNFWVYS